MGDACGIGPEIIVRAFERGAAAGCVVVGDVAVHAPRRRRSAPSRCRWRVLDTPADAPSCPPRCLPVWQPAGLPAGLAQLPWGRVDARAGAAAAACIEAAVRAVQGGEGCGHRHRADAQGGACCRRRALPRATPRCCRRWRPRPARAPPPVRMMLANDELRVVLVTIHLSLRAAIEAVTFDAVLGTLRIAHAAAAPGPGAAAHRGGRAQPACRRGRPVRRRRATHHRAGDRRRAWPKASTPSGPFAPDTVFMRRAAGAGEFDLVVAMTHDHGLIPVKYLGVEHGVNVTLGLPFVRTSPDHGTAFDIAGRGTADPASLLAAIAWARRAAATTA